MTTKKLTLEFEFEEVTDELDKDYKYLVLGRIERVSSELSEDELSGLGEEIAQSDQWQVDRWCDIQSVLGGVREKISYIA